MAAVDIYFPALSSNQFVEGPTGYFSFPLSLVEDPPGSGLYEIPGYLIDEGNGTYSIPPFMMGQSNTGTSNIRSFSVQEDATPIEPSSSFGGVGQITVGLDDYANAPRLIGEVVLTDGSRGKTSGTIRSVSGNDGLLSLTADSALGSFNTDRVVPPFNGTLQNAIQFYCDMVGIQNDVLVDPTVASRAVVYPGWSGNMWVRIKQLLAREQVEMALVFDRVYVRPLRQLIANQNKLVSSGWNVDNSNAAKKVEIYYYNNTYGTQREVYPVPGEEPSLYSVNAGETITFTQKVNASLTHVNQPTPVNFVSNTTYGGTGGVYAVTGSDNLPVTASQWTAQGGRIEVTISEDDSSVLEIKVTGAADPGGNLSPYRIAMSSGGSNDYNSLHITGTGVVWDKKMVTLTTGVTNETSSTEVGVTVDNPFISTREEAFSLGVKTAQAYAGVKYTVTGSAYDLNRNGEGNALIQATIGDFNEAVPAGTSIEDFNIEWAGSTIYDFNVYWAAQVANLWENQLFGNAPGARVLEPEANFRIISATTTESTVQYNAELDTIVGDFNERWTGDDTTTVVTNLATNPNQEAFGASTTVRTNRVLNPALGVDGAGYATGASGTGGTSAGARVVGAGRNGGNAWVKTWSVAPSALGAGITIDFGGTSGATSNNAILSASTAYTVQVWFYAHASGQYNLVTVERDAGGTNTPSGVNNALHSCVAGWNLLTTSRTSTATTAFLRLSINMISGSGALPTTSSEWRVTEPTMEYTTAAGGPTFSGATPAAGDFTYAWAGTAHASVSFQQAPAIAGASAYNGSLAARWSSVTEYDTDLRSLACMPVQTANSVGFIWNASTLAGQIITAIVRVKAPVGVTLTLSARTSGGGAQAPVNFTGTGAWETVTMSAAAATDGALVGVQVYNSGTRVAGASGIFYVDRIIVVVGSAAYTDPYFDGATPDTHLAGVTTVYAWTAAANASTSTRTVTTGNYLISDFNAQYAGMTMKDFAVIPLRKEF